MKLAINALSSIVGGGQVYLSNVLHYIGKFPEIKIYVFAPPQFTNLYKSSEVQVIPCAVPSKSLLHRLLWERWKLPQLLEELEIDMLFCPGGIISTKPPTNCLTATTFQNMLIFDREGQRRYKFSYQRFRLELLKWISAKSFKNADLLIFISEYAKKIIDEAIPDRRGSSTVIPHGLDDTFRTACKDDVNRLAILPDTEYLLYVSVLDVFKAQVEVIRAYHSLCQKRITKEKLLLVGPEYPPYGRLVRREIERRGLQDKVILIGKIPYSDMPSLYHHAKAHIYASSCENCPNIVLESLGSGRPLFLSKRPPMPEFVGDAAVYYDPYDPCELTDLLLRYLDDEVLIMEMGKRAFEISRNYSWETTAIKTFEALKNVYNSSRLN